MLTQEQVIDAIKKGRKSEAIDRRDFSRLVDFFPEDQMEIFGFSVKEGAEWKAEPWTEERVLRQLGADVEFAFEKAYDQRGLSASSMYAVVKMWMWVLEDKDLQEGEDFNDYGIGYLRKVAEGYGLTDPGQH